MPLPIYVMMLDSILQFDASQMWFMRANEYLHRTELLGNFTFCFGSVVFGSLLFFFVGTLYIFRFNDWFDGGQAENIVEICVSTEVEPKTTSVCFSVFCETANKRVSILVMFELASSGSQKHIQICVCMCRHMQMFEIGCGPKLWAMLRGDAYGLLLSNGRTVRWETPNTQKIANKYGMMWHGRPDRHRSSEKKVFRIRYTCNRKPAQVVNVCLKPYSRVQFAYCVFDVAWNTHTQASERLIQAERSIK